MEIRMTSVKSKIQVAMVLAVTVIVYAAIVIVGLRGSLNGDFDQYLVPGKYAAPANITAHGFDNRVFYEKSSGWDGQFYYYHSDDPLLLKDTVEHIDMPAYRAQRVGIPAITYVLSRLTGQDWVSPKFYFTVTVGLQLIAAYMLATFLISRGYSAWYALIWTVGGSTLYTVAFGFIDGSADALVIISLILYANKKINYYLAFISLAVLSKESYAIIPIALGLSQLAYHAALFLYSRDKFKFITAIKSISTHTIPVIILITWLFYLHIHLHTPALVTKSGAGMMGAPFVWILTYIIAGLNGDTLSRLYDMTQKLPPYQLSFGVFVFLLLLLSTLTINISRMIRSRRVMANNPIKTGVMISSVALSAAYICMGPVQVWEPVGFVKASSLVVVLFLLSSVINEKKISLIVIIISISLCAYSFEVITNKTSNIKFNVEYDAIQWVESEPMCLKSANASVDLISLNPAYSDTMINRLIMPKRYIATVKIANKSDHPLSPFKGKGTTNAGYQWFSSNASTLIFDGGRVPLPRTLLNGESEEVSFLVNPPTKSGSYTLRLTLVQEGCSWLYNINPAIKHDLKMEM